MKIVPQLVTLIVVTFQISEAIPIKNGVKGYPAVVCGSDSIQVEIETEKTFAGRLYIKGEAHKKECSKSFESDVYSSASEYGKPAHTSHGPIPAAPGYGGSSNLIGPVVGVDIKLGECNMQRKRTLYPRGVEYTFTLVASFHPLFLTKVDRAYRIRCFYMEADKTVNTQLDVSMLTTRQVNEQFPMPQCRYHLKRDGPDGPYVRYAKVGDKVVHVWECDKSAGYVYGILVKNCYVDDGQGNKVPLVDEKGCSIDQHLIAAIKYDDHLIAAHVQTHVFKYADKPHLLFTCTVQLCYKRDGGCYGVTPPKCAGSYETHEIHDHSDHGEHKHNPSVGYTIKPISNEGYPNIPPPSDVFSSPSAYPDSAAHESYGKPAPYEPVGYAKEPHSYNPVPYDKQQNTYEPVGYEKEQGPYGPAEPYEKPAINTYGTESFTKSKFNSYGRIRIENDYDGDVYNPQGTPPKAETYGGPYQPIGPQGSRHGLIPAVPYKDDPLSEDVKENSTESKHKVGALENRKPDTTKAKRSILKSSNVDSMETDLSAQPLVVLPFDEETDEDNNQEHDLSFLQAYGQYRLNSHSVCFTAAGFGLALSLFIVSVLTTTTTVALLIRKHRFGPIACKA